jgi:hypothetical protein
MSLGMLPDLNPSPCDHSYSREIGCEQYPPISGSKLCQGYEEVGGDDDTGERKKGQGLISAIPNDGLLERAIQFVPNCFVGIMIDLDVARAACIPVGFSGAVLLDLRRDPNARRAVIPNVGMDRLFHDIIHCRLFFG